MLYPDSERRISDIQRMAKLFEEKEYQETSRKILSFSEILKGDRVPSDFLKRLDSLFDLFNEEFVKQVAVGQDYRKRIFEEIKGIVLEAISRANPNFSQAILEIHPLIKRINHGKSINNDVAPMIDIALEKKDVISLFHLFCYSYLIMVEGIFDELARILYFLKTVSKDNIPNIKDLEKMTVWGVLNKVKPTPVFLKNWEEKKHIRNAIAHARAYYHSKKNEILFIDIKWKMTISMSKFVEIGLELEDSVSAFYYIIILLRLYDLIVSKDPYR